MSKRRILAMFKDFEDSFAAVNDVKNQKCAGVSVEDLTMFSPIDNPQMDEALGIRPVNVQ